MLWLVSSATRFLIQDRDSVYGAVFNWRVRNLGISQPPVVCVPPNSHWPRQFRG
jgi:hypothetical protein